MLSIKSVPLCRRASALRRLAILAWVCLLPAVGWADEAGTLRAKVTSLAGELERSTSSVVGVSVYDLRTGRPMVEVRGGELFAPASNQKLLTSAFALASLGAEFRFTTKLYRLGDDLLVVGDGDPTLGDPVLAAERGASIYDELDRWAAAVKESFGDQPVGDLILCCPGGEPGRHPDWPASQHHRWYAAPVSRLNFHNNCFDVTFSVADGRAVATVTPESRFIEVLNNVSVGPKQVWSLRANDDESQLTLQGTARKSSTEPLSVAANHPPLMFGRTLADRLARAGVTLDGQLRQVEPASPDLTAAHELAVTSAPLAEALARANKRSLNMAAESIFLRAGDGTWAGSAAAMTDTLCDKYGLAPEQLTVRDGSGLSRDNRVTPAAMAQLLTVAAGRLDAMTLILSLPRGGADGTLSRRFTEAPCLGRVLGKTGYIAGASCLSGYVLDDQYRPVVAFSILVNRVPGGKAWLAKKMQDSICESIVRYLDAEASANTPQ